MLVLSKYPAKNIALKLLESAPQKHGLMAKKVLLDVQISSHLYIYIFSIYIYRERGRERVREREKERAAGLQSMASL